MKRTLVSLVVSVFLMLGAIPAQADAFLEFPTAFFSRNSCDALHDGWAQCLGPGRARLVYRFPNEDFTIIDCDCLGRGYTWKIKGHRAVVSVIAPDGLVKVRGVAVS